MLAANRWERPRLSGGVAKVRCCLGQVAFATWIMATSSKTPPYASVPGKIETQKLRAGDAAADDRFGASAAIAGNLAVVGAAYEYDGATSPGSAYVFRTTDGGLTWIQTEKLAASDTDRPNRFGVSVAISGDLVVVGAWDEDVVSNSGSAYVFRTTDGGLTWKQSDKLTANDKSLHERFGFSVAIDSDLVVAGAYRVDDDGSRSGSSYIFRTTDGGLTWTQTGELATPARDHEFGISVAISGDVAVLGTHYNDDLDSGSGSAHVFRTDDDGLTWAQTDVLTSNDSAESDRFGVSVAISGQVAVIGAHYDNDDAALESGSAYVFRTTDGGVTWTQTERLTASDADEGDRFGVSVAISGDIVIIGAYLSGESGSAYVFRTSDGGLTWTQTDKLEASDAGTFAGLGHAVAISGTLAVCGVDLGDDGKALGSAYAYALASAPRAHEQPSTVRIAVDSSPITLVQTALCRTDGCSTGVVFNLTGDVALADASSANLSVAVGGDLGLSNELVTILVNGGYVAVCGAFGGDCNDPLASCVSNLDVSDDAALTGSVIVTLEANSAVNNFCAYAGFNDVAAIMEATLTFTLDNAPTYSPTGSPTYVPTVTLFCLQESASSQFESIATAEPNVLTLDISSTDDGVEEVDLPFGFPWFNMTLTSVVVSANGQLNMDGSTDSNCCSADKISATSFYNGDRIAFAQEDLNPSVSGSIFYLDRGSSVVISFEGVPFFGGAGEVNAQVELFSTGRVELRWGLGDTATDSMAAGLQSDAFSIYAPVVTAGGLEFVEGVATAWPANDSVAFDCMSVPSPQPSISPIFVPTMPLPSPLPSTSIPTPQPSTSPTSVPTTSQPSPLPSTSIPSPKPSTSPTGTPTSPSVLPSLLPTVVPSTFPSPMPTPMPTLHPSPMPTAMPSLMPSPMPTVHPSPIPTGVPSPMPSPMPTLHPSPMPSAMPSPMPTPFPSAVPTALSAIPSTQSPTASPEPTPEPSAPPTCGKAFCYGRLVPFSTLLLDWDDLVTYAEATPANNEDISTYVEDNQANWDRLLLRDFDVNSRSAETSAAGYTYVAQLLSHDINFEQTSVLGTPMDPSLISNINTPYVDLDTIYDFNGTKVDELATALEGNKFNIRRTPSSGLPRDFNRDSTGSAVTLDQRNDQNRIVSQLTVALMALHNKLVDDGMSFEEARNHTIREWQAVVLHDMLPKLLDSTVLGVVAGGDRKLYVDAMKNQSVMPVEFATAAYRLFHSRANSEYEVNAGTTSARLFDIGNANETNLAGGSPLTDDLVIEWTNFFGSNAQPSRILDPLYSQSIIRLPIGLPGTPSTRIRIQCGTGYDSSLECAEDEGACPICVDEPTVDGEVRVNLALLDLLRGQTHMLAAGLAFADYAGELGVDVSSMIDASYLECDSAYGLPGDVCGPECTACGGTPAFRDYPEKTEVPLIWYLAHESVLERQGRVLGGLGSRIVAETIYGLVEESPVSILGRNGASWTSRITGTREVTVQQVLEFIGWL